MITQISLEPSLAVYKTTHVEPEMPPLEGHFQPTNAAKLPIIWNFGINILLIKSL